jgi:thiol peroxidase
MAAERAGVVTFKGGPLTLVGPALKVGDAAPDFDAIDGTLAPVNLASSRGKVRIFSAVPSLDTPVCSVQSKRFGVALKTLPPSIQLYTVSADLPFAQKRWCGAEGLDLVTLSDHRKLSFAERYGILIKELRLLARAVFVVDAKDRLVHVQIVPEVTSEPNYGEALAAAKSAAGVK